jgi:ABC-type transporter Mla MlaB component
MVAASRVYSRNFAKLHPNCYASIPTDRRIPALTTYSSMWQASCSCERVKVLFFVDWEANQGGAISKIESAARNVRNREALMPIRVTEIENRGSGATRLSRSDNRQLNRVETDGGEIALRVEGTLHRRDAELLERVCGDLVSQTRKRITLDLSNLSFLDSDSAAVLCLLKRELGVSLEGLHLFIEKVVELAEECEKVERYRPRTVSDMASQS